MGGHSQCSKGKINKIWKQEFFIVPGIVVLRPTVLLLINRKLHYYYDGSTFLIVCIYYVRLLITNTIPLSLVQHHIHQQGTFATHHFLFFKCGKTIVA
jgi:hypothetical protein